MDIVGIRGTSEMRVDLFLILSLVEVLELHADVRRRVLVCVRAGVLREADRQRTPRDFLLKEVLFVQEQDYRGRHEPLAVAY